jgi:hypothetical protein
VDILIKVLYYLGLFFLLCIGIIALYFLYYKLTNKDETQGFQDFIINKTAVKKDTQTPKTGEVALSDNALDILEETPVVDPLIDAKTLEVPMSTNPIDSLKQEQDTIPDPLFDTTVEQKSVETTVEEDTSVPDWLSGNMEPQETAKIEEEVPTMSVEEKVVDQVDSAPSVTPEDIKTPDIEEETKIADDDVPDWLKQNLSVDTTSDEQ